MITVYLARCLPFAAEARALERLSDGQRAEASRYTHPEARLAFVTARLLLGYALDGRMPVCTNAYGKPLYADVCASLSHTHDVVALAVCPDADVGLDVEPLRRCNAALAKRFFTAEEAAFLAASSAQDADFTTLFTRKEAVLKATGKGLYLPLSAFSVLPLSHDITVCADGRDWRLTTFFHDGYTLSLASPGAVAHSVLKITDEMLLSPNAAPAVPSAERFIKPAKT